MEWISVKEKLPNDKEFVLVSNGHLGFSHFGRYTSKENIPSLPDWLPWKDVKYWMKIPELPN